jgi:hypothetical protein
MRSKLNRVSKLEVVIALLTGMTVWPALSLAAGQSTSPAPRGTATNGTSTRPAGPMASLTPASETQMKEIAPLKTPEEAIDKAKKFFATRQAGAAGAAIEKACELKPEMLTETTLQTPRPWNEFWFAYRALMQEKKLEAGDTGGRLKVAEWLHKAGQTNSAGTLLASILEADKGNAQAQLLAKEWGIGEPPVRFDFSYGVNNPLLLEKWQENSKDLMIRKERVFLVLPYAYSVREGKLTIAKGSLKVTGDDGKACIGKGMITMQAQQAQESDQGARLPQVSLDAGESLWNRFVIEQKADKTDLTPSEPARPMFALPPRTPRDKNAPPEPRRPQEKQQTSTPTAQVKPATGYAAFLVEVPKEFKYLDCEYRGTPPLRLDAVFLEALAVGKDSKGVDRGKTAEQLAGFVTAKEAAVASAAVAKLASLKGAQSGDSPTASLDLKIDKILIAAMRHPDPLTRRAAFTSVVRGDQPPSEPTLELFRGCPDPEAAMAAIDVLAGMLKPTAKDGQSAPQGQTVSGDETLASAVADLPPSPAGPGLYAVLLACLQHKDAAVREHAVDAILIDGTQQSVAALSKASPDTRQLIIARLAKLPDGTLKSAVFRVMLLRADAATLSRLVPACPTVSLTITSDKDPLLTALTTQNSPAVVQLLLDVLSRADVSAIAGSDTFSKILDGVITTQQKAPTVRAAMLKLALAGFKGPYQAPIKRTRQSSNTKGAADAGFEFILASLAATSDTKTANSALTALLSTGRIDALLERLKENTTDQQRQMLMEGAIRNRNLWGREALPSFLGTRLADKDPKTQQLALMGLAAIQKSTTAKERWRFNLAVKQAPGFDYKQLLELSASTDETTAQSAADLLLQLAAMPAADSTEFKNAADKGARENKLSAFEQARTAKPAGQYVAMVYADLRAPDAPQQRGQQRPDDAAKARGPKPQPRSSVPLRAGTVTLQAAGNNVRIMMDGQDIEASGDKGGSGALKVNAGTLLRAAFASPEAAKEGVAERIDLTSLNERRECELKYDSLGAWSGEVNIQEIQDPTADPDRPLRLVGAKIVFEPLPTN